MFQIELKGTNEHLIWAQLGHSHRGALRPFLVWLHLHHYRNNFIQ